jgi:hypothetical protein
MNFFNFLNKSFSGHLHIERNFRAEDCRRKLCLELGQRLCLSRRVPHLRRRPATVRVERKVEMSSFVRTTF